MKDRGVIGVLVDENGVKTRCSVAVRAEQSRKELEEQVLHEHPNTHISLVRMYTFSCKGNVVDVEMGLRKILCQKFGPYTPSNFGLESYSVGSLEEFMEFIETMVCLIDNITVVQETE